MLEMEDQLVFEMTMLRSRYSAGEPVHVRFQLLNLGSDPVIVNGRLAINEPNRVGEIWLQGRGPDGRALPFIADVNVGEPPAAEFATLPPSRLIGRHYDASRYLLFAQPGDYELMATYHNRWAGVEGVSSVAWTGELRAKPLTFTLEPADEESPPEQQ
jgi:hypothetical protein